MKNLQITYETNIYIMIKNGSVMVEGLIDFTNCVEIQSNGYNGTNRAKKCIIN